MTFDHIGYAVDDIEKAKKTMTFLGWTFGDVIEDEDRGVYLCFGDMNGARVELVCPIKKDASSVIDAWLSKIGPTPYHICYKTKDLDEEIALLQKKRFKIMVPPAKAIAFGEKRVVFMYALSVGMIEIVEE